MTLQHDIEEIFNNPHIKAREMIAELFEPKLGMLRMPAPVPKLTDEQKTEIAELDNLYQSRLAEREVFLGGKIEEAKLAGDLEAHQQLERELTSDRKTIAAELEEKKEAVRNG